MSYRVDVLDHGFVELIDVMGDYREPARAARISYGPANNARTWEQDAKLTRYLWENKHTTPFEMVELKWRAKMPIFVARQWVRHRTANINEFSMRYADPTKLSEGDEIDYYTPEQWRAQDTVNKQGSLVYEDGAWQHNSTTQYQEQMEGCIRLYQTMKANGHANELARLILPVSVYTEWIWKNDLHNTLHFLTLRTDEQAQREMRSFANAMRKIMHEHEKLSPLMKIVDPNFPDSMND